MTRPSRSRRAEVAAEPIVPTLGLGRDDRLPCDHDDREREHAEAIVGRSRAVAPAMVREISNGTARRQRYSRTDYWAREQLRSRAWIGTGTECLSGAAERVSPTHGARRFGRDGSDSPFAVRAGLQGRKCRFKPLNVLKQGSEGDCRGGPDEYMRRDCAVSLSFHAWIRNAPASAPRARTTKWADAPTTLALFGRALLW